MMCLGQLYLKYRFFYISDAIAVVTLIQKQISTRLSDNFVNDCNVIYVT